MKSILLSTFFIFLFLTQNSLTQVITFEKNYPELGQNFIGSQIIQTDDNGYLICGGSINFLLILKTSEFGDIVWSKKFPADFSDYDLINQLTFTSDSSILIIGTVTKYLNERVALTKVDINMDTVWSTTFEGEDREFGLSVHESIDKNILVLGGVQSLGQRYKKAILYKTDIDGNLLWKNFYKLSLPPGYFYQFTELSDSSIIISGQDYLVKTYSDGDSLWVKNLGYTINSIHSLPGNYILVSTNNKIIKLDSDGLTVWELDFDGNINDVIQTDDGNYLLISDKISKIDSNGDLILEQEILGTGYSIIQTTDNGFAVTGDFNNYMYLIKTDSEGTYRSLELLYPNGSILSYLYNLSISWESKDVESIDIEYSLDNGNSWDVIVSNCPSEQAFYTWNIPDINSDNFFVRIKDSFNPYLSDKNNNNIEIVPFFRIGEGSSPGNDSYDYIAINNILMWISNNGDGSHDPGTDGGGFYWPDGLNGNISAVFEDGFVYGGKINDEIKVNGNTHRQGLQAGYISPDGTPSDVNDPVNKIWKIRKDWQLLPDGPWKDQYEYDYNNWPGEYGAPYIDTDNDGIFTSGIDEPEFVGDEVLFYLANDLDPDRSKFTYGSQPIGLEFRTTVWGFNNDDLLNDVIFKKYVVINRSGEQIEDMYFSYWSDDDLGYASDDYAGCDTLLDLGYVYNADNFDGTENYRFYGINPPAVGHMMVQGPIVPASSSDSAKYGGEWLVGYKNLPITTMALHI
ncbi:hypothetical protein ACFLS9_03935 [Bacteroidota bacterium]